MIYKILNILLAINSILIIINIFKSHGWEDTFETLTTFCFLYVIMMIVSEVNAKIDYLINLDKANSFMKKILTEKKGPVKKVDSIYGYNDNLEWVEIYHSESNLLEE